MLKLSITMITNPLFGEVVPKVSNAAIPGEHWGRITAVEFTDEDLLDTADALKEEYRIDKINLELGQSVLILATQIRLFDFDELTDSTSAKANFNDKKQDILWLTLEAYSIAQEILPSQE